MAKETFIKLRCTQEFKDQVEQAAIQEDRNSSSYIEHLLLEDIRAKGIKVNNK